MSRPTRTRRPTTRLIPPTLLLGLAFSLAGAARSATITMDPSTASVNAFVGRDFSLRLDGGESTTRTLDFTVSGSGGCGFGCASTSVAMIVFDGAAVVGARDTDGGLFSAGNVVRGFVTSGGAVGGLLIDFGQPSTESFRLTLSAIPTTATLYALNLSSLAAFDATRVLRSNLLESTRLAFTVGAPSIAVPEPTAAAVFGAGLLVAAGVVRRPMARSSAPEPDRARASTIV